MVYQIMWLLHYIKREMENSYAIVLMIICISISILICERDINCKKGFFGYACQYINVINNSILTIPELADDSYDTCVTGKTAIEIRFTYTRVRFVRFRVQNQSESKYFYFYFNTSDDFKNCKGVSVLPDSNFYEYHCRRPVKADGLTIINFHQIPICHIEVTNGRYLKMNVTVSALEPRDVNNTIEVPNVEITDIFYKACYSENDNSSSCVVVLQFEWPILLSIIEMYCIIDESANVSVEVMNVEIRTSGNKTVTVSGTVKDSRYEVNTIFPKDDVEGAISLTIKSSQEFIVGGITIIGDCPMGTYGMECSEKCSDKCKWCSLEGSCLDNKTFTIKELNVALHRPTSQSSTHIHFGSDKAVDGNTDGEVFHNHCSHTDRHDIGNKHAWFKVTFPKSHIYVLQLYNRDYFQDRLRGFKLQIFDNNTLVDTYQEASDYNQHIYTIIYRSCITATQIIITQSHMCDQCDAPILTICEIEIFGNIIECQPGYYGNACYSACSIHCSSNTCDRKNGHCICKHGYFGAICDQVCSKFCAGDGGCDNNGDCIFGCTAGYWGMDCRLRCSPFCADDGSCNSAEICVHGCKSGIYGSGCSKRCDTCNGKCDIHGNCLRGCISKFFGQKCTHYCSPYCANDGSCDNKGFCTFGCHAGYFGPRCFHLGLSSNYSDTETWTCHCHGDKCNDILSMCSEFDKCITGWFGFHCDFTLTEVENEINLATVNDKGTNYLHSKQLKFKSITENILEIRYLGVISLSTLHIYWSGKVSLCSLSVNGDYYVALAYGIYYRLLKNRHLKELIKPITDGDISGANCVDLISHSYKDLVYFFEPVVWISTINIYPDPTKEVNAVLQFEFSTPSSSKIEKFGTLKGKTVVSFPFFLPALIESMKITVLNQSVHVCEIEIFGECAAPHYGFGCRHLCSMTCSKDRCDYRGQCLRCISGRTGPHCLDYYSVNADRKITGGSVMAERDQIISTSKCGIGCKQELNIFLYYLVDIFVLIICGIGCKQELNIFLYYFVDKFVLIFLIHLFIDLL